MQRLFDTLTHIGQKRHYNAGELLFFEGESIFPSFTP